VNESSSDYAGPPGWGIDWSAPQTWSRFFAYGTLLPRSIAFIAVAFALVLAVFLDISSFWAFGLHVLLSVSLCGFLSYLALRSHAESPEDLGQDKLGIIASSRDKRFLFCLLILILLVAGGATYAALSWLGIDDTVLPLSAIAAVQVTFAPLGPYPWIRALGGRDLRDMPEATAADMAHALKASNKGVMIFAMGSMFIGLFLLAVVVVYGIARS